MSKWMAQLGSYCSISYDISCPFGRARVGAGVGATVVMPGAHADGERIERDWAALTRRDWTPGGLVGETDAGGDGIDVAKT